MNLIARGRGVSQNHAERFLFAAAAEPGAPNRVLKELIGRDCVEARPGVKDRRQRQLFLTARGQAVALAAAILQSRRFVRVFGERSEVARAQAIAFLLAMVDAGQRNKIAAMTGAGPAARQQR